MKFTATMEKIVREDQYKHIVALYNNGAFNGMVTSSMINNVVTKLSVTVYDKASLDVIYPIISGENR